MDVDIETKQIVTSISSWIMGCFERGKVTEFQLLRRDLGAVDGFVLNASWLVEDFENKDPEEFAATMFAEAMKDAAVCSGRLRYRILAFRESDDAGLPFARTSFRLFGEGVEVDASEAPVTVRMTRHLVGLVGCMAEAAGDALHAIGSSAREYSEGS